MRKLTLLAVVAAATFVIFSGSAFAAKGGNGNGKATGLSTNDPAITLNESDPHLGDTVTFTTSGGGRYVTVACYQNGLVYSAEQAVGTSFLLGGSASQWLTNGGSALCYAWLYDRNLGSGFLASTSFTAAGAR